MKQVMSVFLSANESVVDNAPSCFFVYEQSVTSIELKFSQT